MVEKPTGVREDKQTEIVTVCYTCGADETDDPGVTVTREEPKDKNPRKSLLVQSKETYECRSCGVTDEVNTAVVGQEETDLFGLTNAPIDGEMVVQIDGERIHYKDIEEFVVETTLYDRAGITNHGSTRQVRILAFKPPTLSKNNAYRVQIGQWLDERMLLTGIRYFTSDDPWRRLSFTRGLDNGVMDTVENLGRDPIDGPTTPQD